jgi:(p)ppGpp synthase/HD superfamily hydrolase
MDDINLWQSKFEPCQYSDQLIESLAMLNKEASQPVDILEITKAIYYARKYHGTQLRKSGHPYYYHPIAVSLLFSEYVATNIPQYYTTNLVIVAILHDCIEDTTLTKEKISEIFGKIVSSQVEDLTRVKNGVKITAAETLHILYSQGKDDVLHIKLFDRLHNIQTIYAMSAEKQQKIAYETENHFIPYARLFKLYDVVEELEQICNGITKPRYRIIFNTNELSEIIRNTSDNTNKPIAIRSM